MNKIITYISRLVTAFSVLLNVFLGGKSNQTFSARNYGWKLKGRPNLVFIIDAIFFLDDHHCKEAWDFWISIQKCYP